MYIQSLYIKHFRCFEEKQILFDGKLVLIDGMNGVGKTSLLEALHYMCYLSSFRTSLPKEMIAFHYDNFFLKIDFCTSFESQHVLQVGFSHLKKRVKLDNKAITSYKDIFQGYRVIVITEDDLAIVKDAPSSRRAFLDQCLLIHSSVFLENMRLFKSYLAMRNMLLTDRDTYKKEHFYEQYQSLTDQMFMLSNKIDTLRIDYLAALEQEINKIITEFFDDMYTIKLVYTFKNRMLDSGEAMAQHYYEDECRFRRTLFGPHLNDFVVTYNDNKAKRFSSRGQQKLVILLLKLAHMDIIEKMYGPSILLIDDFMADFDASITERVYSLLVSRQSQLILTVPLRRDLFTDMIVGGGARVIKLT